jgi:hypothetical protein
MVSCTMSGLFLILCSFLGFESFKTSYHIVLIGNVFSCKYCKSELLDVFSFLDAACSTDRSIIEWTGMHCCEMAFLNKGILYFPAFCDIIIRWKYCTLQCIVQRT